MAMRSEGIELRIGDGVTPTEGFDAVGEVLSVSGIGGGSATVIDVSHLKSAFRAKLMGLADEGQVSVGLRWVGTDATHQQMWTDRAAKTLRNFEVEYPDGTVDEFAAYILSMETAAEVDADVTHQVTLEISGAVTRTWGT